ncbi:MULTISPECIES: hypothetical protein [unclassified Nocardia]|uniref:hypothetical protein n=1 Tax=unclassified Nocardia TaxID=2637762 RepID=UPI0024A8EA0A|nr:MULTISPECIES: hypothetical protein [unclassified Nocardia]
MRGVSKAQEAILFALIHGGALSVDQLAREARCLGLRTRIAVGELANRGAVVCPSGSARYQITATGRELAAAVGVNRRQVRV